jgi:hypothetical protein
MQVIETPVGHITTEPIDDVPLLVAQLQKMRVAPLLDKQASHLRRDRDGVAS